MRLFAKCIETTSRAGFIHAQHHAGGICRRAGHVRRNGGHVAGITDHVRPEYSPSGQDALWIGACAHQLQRRLRTIDPGHLEKRTAFKPQPVHFLGACKAR